MLSHGKDDNEAVAYFHCLTLFVFMLFDYRASLKTGFDKKNYLGAADFRKAADGGLAPSEAV